MARNNYGWTSLHCAANSNKESKVSALLIDRGAYVAAMGNNHQTPLHQAAIANPNPAISALLIDRGADIAATDKRGNTALHFAAFHNAESSVITLLLDRGANIEAKTYSGMTPLHLAASLQAEAAVSELLLDRGADIEATDNRGQTPLHLAASITLEAVMNASSLVFRKDAEALYADGRTPLHRTTQHSASPVLIELLKDMATRGSYDIFNITSKMLIPIGAIYSRSLKVIALLLDRSASIQVRDSSGKTPLHLATWYGTHPDIIEYLLERGAAVGERVLDMFGWTALHLTAGRASEESNSYAAIKKLLQNGADPNMLTYDGKTPYQIAMESGASEEVLQLLRG